MNLLPIILEESKSQALIEKYRGEYESLFRNELEFTGINGEVINSYDRMLNYYIDNNPENNLNNKYLKFYLDYSSVPNVAEYGNNVLIGGPVDIMDLIIRFNKVLPYLENKDIYSPRYHEKEFDGDGYLQPLINAIEDAEIDYNRKKSEKDVDKIYEDKRWLVVSPKTHEASCKYGAGTKWCTTQKDGFNQYGTEGKQVIYIIDKSKKEVTPYYKIAIAVNNGVIHSFWDDEDKEIRNIFGLLPKIIETKIRKYIDKPKPLNTKTFIQNVFTKLVDPKSYLNTQFKIHILSHIDGDETFEFFKLDCNHLKKGKIYKYFVVDVVDKNNKITFNLFVANNADDDFHKMIYYITINSLSTLENEYKRVTNRLSHEIIKWINTRMDEYK